jgi:hypothetical protein
MAEAEPLVKEKATAEDPSVISNKPRSAALFVIEQSFVS